MTFSLAAGKREWSWTSRKFPNCWLTIPTATAPRRSPSPAIVSEFRAVGSEATVPVPWCAQRGSCRNNLPGSKGRGCAHWKIEPKSPPSLEIIRQYIRSANRPVRRQQRLLGRMEGGLPTGSGLRPSCRWFRHLPETRKHRHVRIHRRDDPQELEARNEGSGKCTQKNPDRGVCWATSDEPHHPVATEYQSKLMTMCIKWKRALPAEKASTVGREHETHRRDCPANHFHHRACKCHGGGAGGEQNRERARRPLPITIPSPRCWKRYVIIDKLGADRRQSDVGIYLNISELLLLDGARYLFLLLVVLSFAWQALFAEMRPVFLMSELYHKQERWITSKAPFTNAVSE